MGCATEPCGRRDSLLPGPGMKFADGRWHCYLCYLMPKLFPQPEPKSPAMQEGKPIAEEAAKRDGDPKLAAERKRPLARKSNRAGPNWVPHDRRV